jgi:MoaD family protein
VATRRDRGPNFKELSRVALHRRSAEGTRQVKVRLFAQLRDLVGCDTLDVDLANGAAVSDLLEEIYKRFPAVRSHDKSILVAAGLEFVDRNYNLKPGDEISVMPPVQGG